MKTQIVLLLSIIMWSALGTNNYAQQRNPLLEEVAGTWCQWCPCGNAIIEQIEASMPNAIIIQYHQGDEFSNFPGSHINNLLGFVAHPTAVTERTGVPMGRDQWMGLMQQRNSIPPTVELAMNKSFDRTTGELSATVFVKALQDMEGSYKLNVVVIENGIVAPQAGNSSCPGSNTYVHNRLVRTMITGAAGEELNGANAWNSGETITLDINYPVTEVNEPDSSSIVVFVAKVNSPFYKGEIQQAEKWSLVGTVTGVEDEANTLPAIFSLEQNYPNPFNPRTKINWQSAVGSWQTIKVYDVLGNEVVTLIDEFREAGSYEVNFDATGFTSGVYFYTLRATPILPGGGQTVQGYVETKKMLLMK